MLVLNVPEVVDQVREDRHAVMHLHDDILDEDGLLNTINFIPSVQFCLFFIRTGFDPEIQWCPHDIKCNVYHSNH